LKEGGMRHSWAETIKVGGSLGWLALKTPLLPFASPLPNQRATHTLM
jgi:hypothetical protein